MQAEISPALSGPGSQSSGHGFSAGREAFSMTKDFQATGDISAVARTAAKNTLTYNQEFNWGDAVISFQYQIEGNRWTNNGRTLEEISSVDEVGGDRLQRVLTAERKMQTDPKIQQTIVASEDLDAGYNRHYFYVFTKNQENPKTINALAIEFQGTKNEFQNALGALSQRSQKIEVNRPESNFTKPLFFKNESKITVEDVLQAAVGSYDTPKRREEMGNYLNRISRDTKELDNLLIKRKEQEEILTGEIEKTILSNSDVVAGISMAATGLLHLSNEKFKDENRTREVNDHVPFATFKNETEKTVLSKPDVIQDFPKVAPFVSHSADLAEENLKREKISNENKKTELAAYKRIKKKKKEIIPEVKEEKVSSLTEAEEDHLEVLEDFITENKKYQEFETEIDEISSQDIVETKESLKTAFVLLQQDQDKKGGKAAHPQPVTEIIGDDQKHDFEDFIVPAAINIIESIADSKYKKNIETKELKAKTEVIPDKRLPAGESQEILQIKNIQDVTKKLSSRTRLPAQSGERGDPYLPAGRPFGIQKDHRIVPRERDPARWRDFNSQSGTILANTEQLFPVIGEFIVPANIYLIDSIADSRDQIPLKIKVSSKVKQRHKSSEIGEIDKNKNNLKTTDFVSFWQAEGASGIQTGLINFGPVSPAGRQAKATDIEMTSKHMQIGENESNIENKAGLSESVIESLLIGISMLNQEMSHNIKTQDYKAKPVVSINKQPQIEVINLESSPPEKITQIENDFLIPAIINLTETIVAAAENEPFIPGIKKPENTPQNISKVLKIEKKAEVLDFGLNLLIQSDAPPFIVPALINLNEIVINQTIEGPFKKSVSLETDTGLPHSGNDTESEKFELEALTTGLIFLATVENKVTAVEENNLTVPTPEIFRQIDNTLLIPAIINLTETEVAAENEPFIPGIKKPENTPQIQVNQQKFKKTAKSIENGIILLNLLSKGEGGDPYLPAGRPFGIQKDHGIDSSDVHRTQSDTVLSNHEQLQTTEIRSFIVPALINLNEIVKNQTIESPLKNSVSFKTYSGLPLPANDNESDKPDLEALTLGLIFHASVENENKEFIKTVPELSSIIDPAIINLNEDRAPLIQGEFEAESDQSKNTEQVVIPAIIHFLEVISNDENMEFITENNNVAGLKENSESIIDGLILLASINIENEALSSTPRPDKKAEINKSINPEPIILQAIIHSIEVISEQNKDLKSENKDITSLKESTEAVTLGFIFLASFENENNQRDVEVNNLNISALRKTPDQEPDIDDKTINSFVIPALINLTETFIDHDIQTDRLPLLSEESVVIKNNLDILDPRNYLKTSDFESFWQAKSTSRIQTGLIDSGPVSPAGRQAKATDIEMSSMEEEVPLSQAISGLIQELNLSFKSISLPYESALLPSPVENLNTISLFLENNPDINSDSDILPLNPEKIEELAINLISELIILFPIERNTEIKKDDAELAPLDQSAMDLGKLIITAEKIKPDEKQKNLVLINVLESPLFKPELKKYVSALLFQNIQTLLELRKPDLPDEIITKYQELAKSGEIFKENILILKEQKSVFTDYKILKSLYLEAKLKNINLEGFRIQKNLFLSEADKFRNIVLLLLYILEYSEKDCQKLLRLLKNNLMNRSRVEAKIHWQSGILFNFKNNKKRQKKLMGVIYNYFPSPLVNKAQFMTK